MEKMPDNLLEAEIADGHASSIKYRSNRIENKEKEMSYFQ